MERLATKRTYRRIFRSISLKTTLVYWTARQISSVVSANLFRANYQLDNLVYWPNIDDCRRSGAGHGHIATHARKRQTTFAIHHGLGSFVIFVPLKPKYNRRSSMGDKAATTSSHSWIHTSRYVGL